MRNLAVLTLALSAAASARADNGVSDGEVVLGSSAAYHGPSASLGVEQWRGFTAYFDQVNAAGGVHGRRLRVIAYDDGYEPLYSVANTMKLLDHDKVFALFGYVGTPTLVRALPLLLRNPEAGAFLFSNFTGAQPQREPPFDKLVFNVRASYREETAGLVEHLTQLGIKRIALFLQDDAYGKSGQDGVDRALAAKQLATVAVARYRRGMRFDESAADQVRQLLAARPQAVIAIGAYQGGAAFIRDARVAGFDGVIANVSFVGADAMLDLLLDWQKRDKRDVTHRLVVSQVVPNWRDTPLPLVKEYQAAMDRFGARAPEIAPAGGKATQVALRRYSFTSLEGYLNARVFVEVLRRCGRELTREGFRKTAESLGPNDLGPGLGLGGPLGFTPTNHQALHEVWYTTVRDGHYDTLRDWRALAP